MCDAQFSRTDSNGNGQGVGHRNSRGVATNDYVYTMPINRGKAEVKGIEAEGMCLLSDDWLTRIASSVAGRVPGFSSFGQSSAYRCRSQRPNCRRLWRPAERRPRANCNRARRRRRQVDLQGHRKPKAAGMEPALAQEVGRGGGRYS